MHLATIFILYHQWPLKYSLFGRHILFSVLMPITLDTVKMCFNAYEVLCWQPQIFYICKPYFFFHMYDPFSIPCLAVKFNFLQVPMNFHTVIHEHFTFGSHITSYCNYVKVVQGNVVLQHNSTAVTQCTKLCFCNIISLHYCCKITLLWHNYITIT